MTRDYILSIVKKLPSNVYGLKWVPTLEPELSDVMDWAGIPPEWDNKLPRHFSDLDHAALKEAILLASPKVIVEIGVDKSEEHIISSTHTLIKTKTVDCTYIGIDIDNKSYLNNLQENIYTLQNDSADRQKLYTLLDELKIKEIDLMFIDGWHSVKQVLAEWQYWEKMKQNGVMVFHDTNCHPGPIAVLDAIDREIFDVKYYGTLKHDWGIGVVRRR